jgi:predicted nucleotidyltransferase
MAVASSETIAKAVRLLVEAAHPEKIILFGSQARGDAGAGSDLDFLVILPTVASRRAEMVRLQRALASLRVPVDVLVYSSRDLEDWGHVIGHVLNEALTEGTILHDAAA